MTARPLCVALGALLLACGVDGEPQDSSGSHWLVCAVDRDCTPYDPAALCAGGYCEDENGERLPADSMPLPDASSDNGGGGAGSGGTVGASPGESGSGGAEVGSGGAEVGSGGAGSEVCSSPPEPLEEPGVFEGDYVITSEDSLNAASTFSEITGSLSLAPRAAADVTDLFLPGLERIGGSLAADLSSSLVRIDVPRLRSVAGDLLVTGNVALTEVSFQSLDSIGGNLRVRDNPELTRLSLPALSSVQQTVEIGPAPLANCEVQALFAIIAPGQTYDAGRADCSCELRCDWWTATCP